MRARGGEGVEEGSKVLAGAAGSWSMMEGAIADGLALW